MLAVVSCALAGTSDTAFTYQGDLNDNGSPANGTYMMEFSLWDALTFGNQIGSVVTINSVGVVDGGFSVDLDFNANAFDNTSRWLQIDVNGTPLSPRQPITRAPYAIQTRGIFVDNDKNVGIGLATPLYPLHVESQTNYTAKFSNTLAGPFNRFAVVAEVLADGGTAVWGLHTSANGSEPAILGETYSSAANTSAIKGVLANSSAGASSAAVRGINFGTGASGIGVWGSQDGEGFGVYGSSPKGIGVYGYSNSTLSGAFNEGVRGQSDFEAGVGVKGIASATSGPSTGVMGTSASSNGDGVFGWATSTTGGVSGVLGRTDSTTGFGVRGFSNATSGTNYGVYGSNASPNGAGVFATTDSEVGTALMAVADGLHGRGVLGSSTAGSGTGVGVMGSSNSTSGWDFYAFGAGIDFGSTSSIRWKRNVANIDDPLAKLSRLRGVYFDWDHAHGGRHDVGMIAEEVGAVLPEIVQFEVNRIDAIGLDYSKLTPLLVEAVNALRAEKDAEITSLRDENAELRARLDRLEAIVEELAGK